MRQCWNFVWWQITLGLLRTQLKPWGSTSSVASIVGRGLHPMMLFEMFLHSLWKMQGFMFYKSKPMFFRRLFFSFLVDRLTLFCQLMAFAHCPMLSLSTHLNKPSLTGNSFSWGGCNIDNFNEGRVLSQP